jgi:AraC-like DNA-binding protein
VNAPLPVASFLSSLRDPFTAGALFDHLPDIVYFIKDRAGRYLEANETLVHRCGMTHKADVIGRTPSQLFGTDFGEHYEDQDRTVLEHGRSLVNLLEMHMYKNRHVGWCLTTKLPLHDKSNAIIGLVGVSQDLKMPDVSSEDFQHIAAAIAVAHDNLSATTTVANMAEAAKMSEYQLDRRMKRVFGISTGEWLLKTRLSVARHRLVETDLPIAAIALEVGYADQSSFARQFRQTIGLPPLQFRKLESRRHGET